MAEKKSFLIRMDAELLEALRRWADDDLRSLNGQLEFLLRRALKESGRVAGPRGGGGAAGGGEDSGAADGRSS